MPNPTQHSDNLRLSIQNTSYHDTKPLPCRIQAPLDQKYEVRFASWHAPELWIIYGWFSEFKKIFKGQYLFFVAILQFSRHLADRKLYRLHTNPL